ncbi:toxin-antitoxin system YwqK family antitoxin [Cyclobacterium qasimii]|uniref:Antitoxin YwqK n=3 Tax=Cyclobacterium qasimii TaxID=1350429 RepID=A0A512CCK2_9BACT|nr:hypothetical protein [Cyclobacterium qasimii]GEO21917.1 hypothetical protein CQA01_24510 [Cyclobacterium qasimii]
MAFGLGKILKMFLVLLIGIGLSSCEYFSKENEEKFELDYSVDTSGIPNDTINFNDANISLVNGYYYLGYEKYSGIIYKKQVGFNISTYSSILDGVLHGLYTSYYDNGKPFEVRNYRNNLSVGKQIGYWEDSGELKFEYNYYEDKKEGVQRSWYANGAPSYVYNYKDDKQDGLQQAWRLNGSLYRNFQVKNGTRFGLQKTTTCYALEDEKII